MNEMLQTLGENARKRDDSSPGTAKKNQVLEEVADSLAGTR